MRRSALAPAVLGLLAAASSAPGARAQVALLGLPVYGAAEAGAGQTTATARGAAALFATPAGMDHVRAEASGSVLRWNEGVPITIGAVAATFPIGAGLPLRPTLGLFAAGYVREVGSDISVGGTRSEALLGAALGLEARSGSRAVRAGMAVKGARVAFDDDAVFRGFSVDAGVQGELGSGDLVAGVGVRHAGPSLSGPGGLDQDLPTEVRVGASWQAFTLRSDDGATLARLRVVADVSDVATGTAGTRLHAGAEVAAFGQFSARLGRIGPLGDTSTEPGRWTFALGYSQGRLRADAAVLPSPEGSDTSASFTLRAML